MLDCLLEYLIVLFFSAVALMVCHMNQINRIRKAYEEGPSSVPFLFPDDFIIWVGYSRKSSSCFEVLFLHVHLNKLECHPYRVNCSNLAQKVNLCIDSLFAEWYNSIIIFCYFDNYCSIFKQIGKVYWKGTKNVKKDVKTLVTLIVLLHSWTPERECLA